MYNQMMNYYQCLTCQVLISDLVKVDKHLEMCLGSALDSDNQSCRGKRPIRTVSFKDCFVPVVRNQIDPEFLKLYDSIEAKSDEETVSNNIKSGKQQKPIVIREKNGPTAVPGPKKKLSAIKNMKIKSSSHHNCSECHSKFSHKRLLQLHVKTVHRQDYDITRQCIFCQKMFVHYRDLEIHVRGHLNERPFLCKLCNQECATNEARTSHEKTHDPNRKLSFECNICDKKFFNNGALYHHLRYHKGDKRFRCSICDKRFMSRRTRKAHMETHKTTRERNVICEICKKSFYSQECLKNHMASHMNEEPVTCNMCDKKFKNTKTLKSHMNQHVNRERKFKCHLCSSKFFEKNTLTGHLKIHTGERPHKCPVCNMAFQTRKGVKRHKSSVHDGIKPIKCSGCGSRFALKHNWISHTQRNKFCSKATVIMVDNNESESDDEEIFLVKDRSRNGLEKNVCEKKPHITSVEIKNEEVKAEEREENDVCSVSDPFMMVTDIKMEFPTLKMSISQTDFGNES